MSFNFIARSALAVFLLQASASFSSQTPAIGRVVQASGKVWATHGTEKPRDLIKGSSIFGDDRIHTAKNSSAKVLLGTSVALQIKQGSELDVGQRNGKDWDLNLRYGALLSVIHNLEKRPNFYRVKTRSAVMGARGTTFFVQDMNGPDENDKPVFFCPCMGEIHLSSVDEKSSMDVKSVKHDTPRLIAAGSGDLQSRTRPISKDFDVNHSDAEIDDLKSLLPPLEKKPHSGAAT